MIYVHNTYYDAVEEQNKARNVTSSIILKSEVGERLKGIFN